MRTPSYRSVARSMRAGGEFFIDNNLKRKYNVDLNASVKYMPRRPDASLVKDITKFHEFEFHIMRGRNESSIHFDLEIDLRNTLAYLKKVNAGSEQKKLTLFHVILCTCVRTVALRPKLNRFVSNRRLWQRNQIILSFVVKKQLHEKSDSTNAMISFSPYETLETISKKVDNHLFQARESSNEGDKQIEFYSKLPRFILRFMFWLLRWADERNIVLYSITKDMPMWSSAFLANLGSIGLPPVYHHLYELGNIGFFLAIGKIEKKVFVDQKTGEISSGEGVSIGINLDDRISEGIYLSKTVEYLKHFIENPQLLEAPPELTEEQLATLNLKI